MSRIPTLLLSAALAAGCCTASALDLVKDGRPAVTIVTAGKPEPPAPSKRRKGANTGIDAASVLVEWIKKITDTELPVTATAPPDARAIWIGQDDGLPREGVRIVADERHVSIQGQNEAATLKAVCRFLEELGCRYFMDGPLGEVHPRGRTLSVGLLDIAEAPGLLYRNPKGPSWPATLWKAWNGAGGETFNQAHSWGRYVKPSLFQEHPEFFAMGADGQRRQGQWLCTTNPALRLHFAEQVIVAIRNGTKHPSLSPPDGRGYCQCPRCKALDDPDSVEPSTGTVSLTNRYVEFFNDIAGRVASACPDSILSFYCYADYTQPATTKTKLAPNLCAVIAPIRYCRLHGIGHEGCPSREQQVAMIDGWAGVADRLGYYNYMYNLADGTLPMFKFTACKKEFPYLKEKGLCAMTIEVLSNWHVYGPQIYLSLRLAYDPAADADALMDDYFRRFYGPGAAPFMERYWMGIDAAMERVNTHAGSFFGLVQIYTPEFLHQCETLLGQAAEAARGEPEFEQRVALHTEGFKSAVDYRQICAAMIRGDFAAAQERYDGMTARLQALASEGWANPEYSTAYLRRFLGKSVRAGAALPKPLQVLPDRWQFSTDGETWTEAATYSKTLDAQGFDQRGLLWYRTTLRVPAGHGPLALFFCEVDGVTEVFINDRPVPAANQARAPFEVDLTGATRVGDNSLKLRIDHSKITDLALGGILRPVLLVEKP